MKTEVYKVVGTVEKWREARWEGKKRVRGGGKSEGRRREGGNG